MAVVYEKSKGLTDAELHYCPGCHHGIIHKLIAESLVELGLLDEAIEDLLVKYNVMEKSEKKSP